jgi:hypothetical protein
MKGLIARTWAAVCGAGLLAATGCCGISYSDWVDPCYPERYEYAARQSVNQAFGGQMQNGHALDQTVWNYHFEAGTDRLTAGGQEHLKYLARRRPHADPVVFLQTAQDVAYDPAAPEKYAPQRMDLNNRRIQAVQNFAAAYAAGVGPEFRVVVHDPAEVGQSAVGVAAGVRAMYAGYAAWPPPTTWVGGAP